MDIRAGIAGLDRDLKACRGTLSDPAGRNRAADLCRCSNKAGKSAKDPPKPKGYHDGCVPGRPQPAGRKASRSPSPKRAQPTRFQKKHHFETGSASIDVEITSTNLPTNARAKPSRSPARTSASRSPPRKSSLNRHKSLEGCGHRDGEHVEQRSGSPKPKVSWGNILRDQNRFPSQPPPDSECRQRPASCDENWVRTTTGFGNNCGRSYPEPAARDRVCVRDTGVQCSSPPPAQQAFSLDKSAFRSCDPVRTLRFLMDEFSAKTKTKCEPEVQSLLADMENALERLNRNPGLLSAMSCAPPSQSAKFAPTNASEEFAPSKCTSDRLRTESRHRSANSANMKMLEDSYQALVKTCQEAEVRCTRLVEEREKQLRDLAEKNLMLEQCAKREREYQCKLADALKRNEVSEEKNIKFAKSVADLTEMLARLQEDHKVVGCLREAQGKLKAKIQELSQDNYRLTTENQLMALEREKNKVLLQIKDQEIIKLKSDIQTIGGMVNEELRSRFKSIRLSSSSNLDMSSSLSLTSHTLNNAEDDENVICSSPNSSGCRTPTPSKSWTRLSKIPPDSVVTRLGKSADVILNEKKSRARRQEEASTKKRERKLSPGHQQNLQQQQQEDIMNANGLTECKPRPECIEALKSRLKGFLEEMQHPLRVGSHCLAARTPQQPDIREESFSSLGSTSSYGSMGDPSQGSCADSEGSFVNLSKFKG